MSCFVVGQDGEGSARGKERMRKLSPNETLDQDALKLTCLEGKIGIEQTTVTLSKSESY